MFVFFFLNLEGNITNLASYIIFSTHSNLSTISLTSLQRNST